MYGAYPLIGIYKLRIALFAHKIQNDTKGMPAIFSVAVICNICNVGASIYPYKSTGCNHIHIGCVMGKGPGRHDT